MDGTLLKPVWLTFYIFFLTGNVIAITKTNFVKLGSYDAMFESGGGENLELSIRASMKCSDIVVSRYVPMILSI